MELWNVYIDARLERETLFDLGLVRPCVTRTHGVLPADMTGKLMGHAVTLESQGIQYEAAVDIVQKCWYRPSPSWTHDSMIGWVVKNKRD